ncbi:MAG: HIRAN domain-containing protein [Candidatus Pacebacteria bacterium]|nr:HIRAN domain-containing protein [Candidatus Paceibacterota bacterium]
MNRGTFIKIIGAGAGSLLLSGIDLNAESLKYDLKQIKIYDNYVRGVNFRKRDFLLANLNVNDILQLCRESDNIYDQFAIKVMKGNKFLGYIPAFENITLAMLMDQGVKLEASVSKLNNITDSEKYLDNVFSVQVFAKLLVPYRHLETTDLQTKRADDAHDIYRQGNKIK